VDSTATLSEIEDFQAHGAHSMLHMTSPPSLASAGSPHSGKTTFGVAYGAAAGALWGLVFLAPALIQDFGPLQLSVGRYALYGNIALALLAPRWHAIRAHIQRDHWAKLFWLALCGNTVYYVLLAAAVQMGGIAMTSLVIGFLPVAVTIIGSREKNAIPLKRLLPSMLFCALGALCIAWQSLEGPAGTAVERKVMGLVCAVGALASWAMFAVGNARSLTTLKGVSAHEWSLLTGLLTGAQAILLVPWAWAMESTDHSTDAWLRHMAVNAVVALLASVIGNACWNRMSRLLPITLVGQMILFETFFALVYAWLWERRLPTPAETLAIACVVLSVLSCLDAHRQSKNA
jgi:drug/metabolite transporter (DMT)-like permease